MSNILKNTFLLGSGFAGGIIAGYFIFPAGNKDTTEKLLNRFKKTFDGWKLKSQAVKEKSAEKLNKLHELLAELREPVPDLYKATESLQLDVDELIHD